MKENKKENKLISSLLDTLVRIHMAQTNKTANVAKILVQNTFLLDSGMPWGSCSPFRISPQSLSTSINLMQRGERESLGHKKSILGICLHANLRQKQIEYQKSRQKGNPRFYCAVPWCCFYYVTNEPFILNQCILQLHLIIVSKT